MTEGDTEHRDFAKGFRCSDCGGDLRVTGRGSDDTSIWEEHECVVCGGEGSYYNSHSRHTPQMSGVTERVYNLVADGGTTALSGPSRSLSVGDKCPTCGRTVTETTAGGLLAYCWWCNDRSVDTDVDRSKEADRDE